jgi:hypothetical protein
MSFRSNARQLVAYVAVLALLALGAGLLGAGPFRAIGRADSGVTWHPVTSSSGVLGLKEPVRGLLDRHHYPKGYETVIKSFVIDVAWADLQPTAGGPLVHPNPIDDALAQAQAAGMRVKLRVGAGINAPEWAKRIGGEPIPIYYTKATAKYAGQLAGTIGRFWLPAFGAAYDDLQQKLAAAYDDNPVLGQVAITRCSTIFSETYLRNSSEQRNVDALLAAGFTRAADDACHDQQMRSHLVWVHTRSSLTFNAYTAISADGSVKQDLPYTLSQMDECRQVLGRRCVLENYSLAWSRLSGGQYPHVYTKMQQLGPPFDFQTATMAKVGDLLGVLDYARSIGATSVELPKGYDTYAPDQLVPFDHALRANTIG